VNATANYETIGNWITQSRNGDRDAFAHLVRQYQGMVSGIALSRTGDIHQSEDLAQETFLLAWRKLPELDDVRKFPGWLCSIARNLARNAVRKKSEQTNTLLEAESHEADPALQLATAEQNALIASALQNIPEKYREPLVLFYRGE
jgi:RNA polymerase sigma factor (sigma-70 family)